MDQGLEFHKANAAFKAGKPAEALLEGQMANAALARAGGNDALQARLHHVRGTCSAVGRLRGTNRARGAVQIFCCAFAADIGI